MRTKLLNITAGIALLSGGAWVAGWHEERVHAGPSIEYLVVDLPVPASKESLQELLDRHGKLGWQLVATPRGHAGTTKEDGFLVFRRN